jgi:3-oxoacyl-[acyl-carrier protein] reductase
MWEVRVVGIDLTGKVAIVTGGSQGLGEATVRLLHRAGASVAINYFDDSASVNRANAQKLADELGERAMVVAADVRDQPGCHAMIDAVIGRFGGLDIVVNNAGIIRDRTLRKMSEDEWQSVIDTNLTGVYHICRAAVDKLRDGGRIVNIASIAASIGFFGQANYAAAKGGVAAMTRVLSRELGKRGITVNAVAPGVVLTDMGKSIPDEVRADMLKNIPLGRHGTREEIAGAIVFLCSDLASFVSGQTLHVNGGWWG